MKIRWKKLAAIAVSCVMASTMAIGFTACGDDNNQSGNNTNQGGGNNDQGGGNNDQGGGNNNQGGGEETYVPKKGTYRTYSSALPSNWNELTYEDNIDSTMIGFLTSSFVSWDYEFDEAKGGKFNKDGSINSAAIVEDTVNTTYSAATKLEDVTATVDAKWGYTDEQKAKGGYAYKFTLRDDLKWDDGTPIDADDFVYTMKEQLNPDYKHYRYSSYLDQIALKNASGYVNQGSSGWFAADTPYGTFEESVYDKIVFSIGSSAENQNYGGATCSMRASIGAGDASAEEIADLLIANGVQATVAEILSLQGKTYTEIAADSTLKGIWDIVIGWWQTDPDEELDFFVTNYTFPQMDFGEVGLYSPSKYELVLCLSAPLADYPLNSDGSLNFWAGYYLSGLPLVKEDKYEQCRRAPSQGSTLWTTNYNTSKDTTASWGPYKLTDYQAGKSYTLELNEYWYGWNMEEYKNQYNVTKYTCEKVEQPSTKWMGFLNGTYDDIAIDREHADEYRNSKYTFFTVDPAQYGASLYANLNVLKQSGRNNGILAIPEFRKAFSMAIDRADYNSTLYTADRPLLGLLNEAYYHDVENGALYRNSDQAKKALLKAYGYYEEEDGTWSNGALVDHFEFEEAYETLSGYDLNYAKQLLEEAYAEVMADPAAYGYDPQKPIQIKYGTYVDNTSTQNHYKYFQEVVKNLTDGTSLEGKVQVIFDTSFSSAGIYDSFKSGEYELAAGLGWGNAPFNPFYMIGCYIKPDTSYSGYWDTYSEMMTFKMPGEEGEYEGAGQEFTMSLMNWYNCLCHYEDSRNVYTFDWSAIDNEYRLDLLAAIEEYLLCQYYFIPTTSANNATMLGAKFSYITNQYNSFMDRGGIRYMVVNYTDSEWTSYVSANNNDLTSEYKKTN